MNGEPPSRVTVIIVDDHPVVRWGFRQMLATDPAIEVVGEAAGMEECLRAVQRKRPDVVLLDLRMPDHDGIEAALRLKRDHPDTKVLVLTVFDDTAHIRAAFGAGADGYLLKTTSCEALVTAVRDVAAGRQVIAPDILRAVLGELAVGQLRSADRALLTDEERRLLRCLASGSSLAEVSATMHWSAATTGRRINQLCDKLGVKNRAQAIYEATKRGLI
jgi:DNA-binding NarL/FixJ family response regulator